MQFVQREQEQEYDQNTGLNDALQRVKGIRRPGGGVGGLMMDQVKDPKEARMMHHSVHPIEIRIVHEQHDGEHQKK